MPTKRVTNVANHTRCVLCFQPKVERALAVFNRAERHLVGIDRGLKVRRKVRKPQRTRQVNQVPNNCAGGRHLSGARTDKHHFAHGASADKDRVARAFYRSQKMMKRYEHRMRPYIQTSVSSSC